MGLIGVNGGMLPNSVLGRVPGTNHELHQARTSRLLGQPRITVTLQTRRIEVHMCSEKFR